MGKVIKFIAIGVIAGCQGTGGGFGGGLSGDQAIGSGGAIGDQAPAQDTASTDSTDTAADTGDTGDYDISQLDGTWSGTMVVDILVEEWDNLTDHCEADVTVTFDSTDVGHEVTGSFTCTWSGVMQQYEEQFGGGLIEGGVHALEAFGSAWYGPITTSWTGTVNLDGEFTGSWSGTQEALEDEGLPEVIHSGRFLATKD